MPSSSGSPGSPKLQLVPIVAIAFILRLVVVFFVARSHNADWFFGQSSELAQLAEMLRSGHGLSSPFGGSTGPSAFLSPGYPAIVAAAFSVFGSYSEASAIAIMCLQALFSTATVLAVMLLARRVFSDSVANTAGIICSLAPPRIVSANALLGDEPLRPARDDAVRTCCLVSRSAVASQLVVAGRMRCGRHHGKPLATSDCGVLLWVGSLPDPDNCPEDRDY